MNLCVTGEGWGLLAASRGVKSSLQKQLRRPLQLVGYCILYTTPCTLHNAHCTLQTAHYTLHTAQYSVISCIRQNMQNTSCKLLDALGRDGPL